MFDKLFGVTIVGCILRYAVFYDKLPISFKIDDSISALQEVRDQTEHQYFQKLATLWDSVEEECQNVELTGKNGDWQMPKWAEGLFVTSGPSKFDMNGTSFGHLLDGFGRFSMVNFQNGKAVYTSKMLKSKFYNQSLQQGGPAPGLLFKETEPPRWKSMIPYFNLVMGAGDNNWVSLELLADNKTFVGTTDTPIKLEIDTETLENKGEIKWEDDGMCISGVSHSRKLPDGTVISLCADFNKETRSLDLVVYKMVGSNTKKRVVIARIPTNRYTIQHAFAMSKDYAVIFEPPYYVQPSITDIMFKNVHLQDMIKNDVNGTTKIHAVRLSDGKVTTIDAKRWSMILHFSNTYQIDEDTLVVEGPAYEKPTANPFTIFLQDYLKSSKGVTNHQHGSVFKRYILNLKTETLEMEDILTSKYGSIDLANYNPKWEGVAKNRYTYLFQLMHQTEINEDYHWPLLKYDDDKKEVVATWGPGLTCAQEPRFIPNPEGTQEDDGIILTTANDLKKQETKIVVIDPKTMTTLQEYVLPFKLPIQFHNNHWTHQYLQKSAAQ